MDVPSLAKAESSLQDDRSLSKSDYNSPQVANAASHAHPIACTPILMPSNCCHQVFLLCFSYLLDIPGISCSNACGVEIDYFRFDIDYDKLHALCEFMLSSLGFRSFCKEEFDYLFLKCNDCWYRLVLRTIAHNFRNFPFSWLIKVKELSTQI